MPRLNCEALLLETHELAARFVAEGLPAELAPYEVDVLVCAPGPVDSGFAARADMRFGAAASPEAVAAGAPRALGRRGTTAPGGLTKVLTASMGILPRVARVRVMARVMDGMTKHQQGDAS